VTAAISGATRFVAMLGDPVVQVKTPRAFNDWARESGEDAVMVPVQVSPAGLGATIAALRGWGNCLGAVVTFPHKQAMANLLDAGCEAVRIVGACNVVRRGADGRLHGGMTDGLGFVAALAANGHDPAGRDARLIGAGGAGSAIALALLDAGVARLVISDTDPGRVTELLARLSRMRPDRAVSADAPTDFRCGLVCNATPVGMNGDTAHPWRLDDLPDGCIVADIVPDPPRTPWIAEARRRGHPVQTGPQMVAAQLPAILTHLFPDRPGGGGC